MKNLLILSLVLISCLSQIHKSNAQDITADTTLANEYVEKAIEQLKAQKLDSVFHFLDLAQPLFTKYLGEKNIKDAEILHFKGVTCFYSGLYDQALAYYKESLALKQVFFGEVSFNVDYSYYNIGLVYQNKEEYNKAMEYYLKCIDIRIALFGQKHGEVAIVYNQIGNIHKDKNEYAEAMEYYIKALKIRQELYGENSIQAAASYNNIGGLYYLKNEFDLALEYFLKAFQIRKAILGENDIRVGYGYNNVGAIYYEKTDYTMALEYYLKALKIAIDLTGDNSLEVASRYHNIGNAYRGLKQNELAIEYYTKALQIRKQLNEEDNTDIASTLFNLGSIYLELEDNKRAIEYLNSSLVILKESLGLKHTDISNSYLKLGEAYINMQNYTLGLKYYHFAIVSNIVNAYDTVNFYSVPSINSYLVWFSLLTSLKAKSQLLANTKMKDLENPSISDTERMRIALLHYQACDTLIDLTRKKISRQSDKLALGRMANEIYQGAIRVSIELMNNSTKKKEKDKYAELAFYFSEKNKSSVLLQALAGKEAQKFAGIPDSLLKIENKLNIDIAFCTKELAAPENLDSTKIVMLQNKLFVTNRSYDSLIQAFERQFPNYYALKYNPNTVSVHEVQKHLITDNKTAFISYSIGDSAITIFTITRKKFDIQQFPRPKNLDLALKLFYESCSNPDKKMEALYRDQAWYLYKSLFPKNLDKRISNLIIIPDNLLAIIPFEAFLTTYSEDTTQLQNLPFLIRDYNISYTYSATLYKHTFPKEHSGELEITPLNDWIAFAPVFDDKNMSGATYASRELSRELRKLQSDSASTRGEFLISGDYIVPLPGTENEVKIIFKYFDDLAYKAKVELHSSVTEQYIKSGILQDYKIIHFATHGFVNSQKPELSGIVLAQDSTGGEDGILYAGEIYNLKMNANLVVLSACETGLGEIKEGEGIIGLTRALLYAGTKNIIVSFWQVSDQSTSHFMIDFYKNMLENNKKTNYSENLRKTKLNMIRNVKYAHPFYWSAFILIGK